QSWARTRANITRGWLLASVILGFVFFGCALYAAVQTVRLDNRVTRDSIRETVIQATARCTETNERRAEAKQIALESAEADRVARLSDLQALYGERAIWESIHEILPDGLPDPVHETIFDQLELREADIMRQQDAIDARIERIESTYLPSVCGE